MIGLIFGESNFPIKILEKIKNRKFKYFIIDLTKKELFKNEKNSHTVSIGEFGKIIKIIKKNKCKKVLFAGKVQKPHFSKLKLDLKGVYYFPRILKSSRPNSHNRSTLCESNPVEKKPIPHFIQSAINSSC